MYFLEEAMVLIGIGALIALIAAIIICAVILPKGKEGQFSGFAKFLRDYFLMRYLMVEAILRFFFVLNTCLCVFIGFVMLFGIFQEDVGPAIFAIGLALMILGPIFTRISYEITMIAILQLKNVIEINGKLKDENGGKFTPTNGPAPQPRPQQPAPQPRPQQPAPQARPQQPVYNGPAPQPAPQPRPQQPAPQQPAPEKPEAKVCPNCGAPVINDATFCDKCGTKLK